MKGNFNFTDTFAAATESGAIRDTRVGWTAGVGTEYAFGNGWSLKAEYLYVDLGRASVTSTNLADRRGSLPAQTLHPLVRYQVEHRARRRELQVRRTGRRQVLSIAVPYSRVESPGSAGAFCFEVQPPCEATRCASAGRIL